MKVEKRFMKRCKSPLLQHSVTALIPFSGFVEEGKAREARWLDGEWCDLIYMGLLEREWKARRDDMSDI
jgi:hypothetical protein